MSGRFTFLCLTLICIFPSVISNNRRRALAAEDNITLCKNLKFFGHEQKQRFVIPNTSNMCPFMETTCCTNKDFELLKKWWEDPLYNDQRSRLQTKRERLVQISAFTYDLLAHKHDLLYAAEKIKQQSEKFSGYCLSSAVNFLTFMEKNSEGLNATYLNMAQKCWKTLNEIQNGVMCMACDPAADEVLDLQNGKVYLGEKTMERLQTDCLPLAYTMRNKVLPYFRKMNELVRCDLKSGKENPNIDIVKYNGLVLDIQGENAENARIDESLLGDLVSFGSRLNETVEGQIGYLINIQTSLKKFLPLLKESKKQPETVVSYVAKAKKTERVLGKKDWLLDESEFEAYAKNLPLSPLSDPTLALSSPDAFSKKKDISRRLAAKVADTAAVQKKNYDMNFQRCRGHVTKKEKENGTIDTSKHNVDETMRQRTCMVMRQMAIDWMNADDDFDEFMLQWKPTGIKENILKQIRCVNYDKTMQKEEEDLLAGDTTGKNYTVMEFKENAKNAKKASGDRCMKKTNKGYKEMAAYVSNKISVTTDYKKLLNKCKKNLNLGKRKCNFYNKILAPMRFVFKNCFMSNGKTLRNTDECNFVGKNKKRERILASEVTKQTMKNFDRQFKSMKKFQITPRLGMSADKVFLKLKKLVKTKLIEKKLNVEGKKVIYISKKDAIYDVLAKTKQMDLGFTEINLDTQQILQVDVDRMIQKSNKDDLEEVELERQDNFYQKRRSQASLSIISTILMATLALLISN